MPATLLTQRYKGHPTPSKVSSPMREHSITTTLISHPIILSNIGRRRKIRPVRCNDLCITKVGLKTWVHQKVAGLSRAGGQHQACGKGQEWEFKDVHFVFSFRFRENTKLPANDFIMYFIGETGGQCLSFPCEAGVVNISLDISLIVEAKGRAAPCRRALWPQPRGPTKTRNVPIIIEINRPKASRECRVKDKKAAEKVRGLVGNDIFGYSALAGFSAYPAFFSFFSLFGALGAFSAFSAFTCFSPLAWLRRFQNFPAFSPSASRRA